MTATIVRSQRSFARLTRAARDALRAARELERVHNADVYGRYVWHPEEELDQDELIGFLELARQLYPGAILEIAVIAQPRAETTEEQENGGEDVRRGL